MQYLKQPLRTRLEPADLDSVDRHTDYTYDRLHRRVWTDDWVPYNAPWRAVPWIEAICGCTIHVGGGSLTPEPCATSAAELAEVALPARTDWLACLERQICATVDYTPPGCWISSTILRGVSDVLAALRGLTDFYCELLTDTEPIARAAHHVNDVLLTVLREHFRLVGASARGYGSFYGYWAPEPTVVMQEDALGMCSPRTYAEIFAPLNAATIAALGRHVLFHLHSTGCSHWREVLALPGLAGLELTLEANGPEPGVLEPMLREILEKKRLVLFIDGHFEASIRMLRTFPRAGLYVIMSQRDVPDDQTYREVVLRTWER